jgi:hypothetical protein
MPDAFFEKFYLQMAMFLSGVYLVIQVFFLVDFIMGLNEKYVQEDNLKIIAIITGVFGIGALAMFGVSYYVFTKRGCSSNYIFISIHMVLSISLFILAAFLPHGSIFTASLIACYCAFLTMSGMMSQTECSRISRSGQGIGFSVIAAIFTLIWAGYSAYSSTTQFRTFCQCGNDEEEEQIFSLSFFHALFALASVYLTMIVSHWGQVEQSDAWATDRGSIPRWVNFAATWLVLLVYGWTLLGRYTPCLKDRVFD